MGTLINIYLKKKDVYCKPNPKFKTFELGHGELHPVIERSTWNYYVVYYTCELPLYNSSGRSLLHEESWINSVKQSS